MLEDSQSDETFHATILLAGKEKATSDFVRNLVERLDREAKANQVIDVMIQDIKVTIKIEYHPGGDGKAATTATGLGGAYCTRCTKTKKEASDPNLLMSYYFDGVAHGFPKDRSLEQNLQLFEKIKKMPDGSVDTRVPTGKRLGGTQWPMGDFLDWNSM